MTARAKVDVRRIDAATAVEVQEVGVVTVRRSRPIVAADADKVENAIAVAATTRSRVPDGGCRTELTGEVHAFVGTIVGVIEV